MKHLDWWLDNLKRPSTWLGFIGLFIGYETYQDKAVLHKFLENLVNNEGLMTLVVGTLSGFLIRHKCSENKKEDKKENEKED
jgi:hypothetical protein